MLYNIYKYDKVTYFVNCLMFLVEWEWYGRTIKPVQWMGVRYYRRTYIDDIYLRHCSAKWHRVIEDITTGSLCCWLAPAGFVRDKTLIKYTCTTEFSAKWMVLSAVNYDKVRLDSRSQCRSGLWWMKYLKYIYNLFDKPLFDYDYYDTYKVMEKWKKLQTKCN